jgi:hypothetical protein
MDDRSTGDTWTSTAWSKFKNRIFLISGLHTNFTEFAQTIFPSPSPPDNPRIAILFRDLFGANLPANRNGNEVLELEIERLRKHATEALRLMNMVPA